MLNLWPKSRRRRKTIARSDEFNYRSFFTPGEDSSGGHDDPHADPIYQADALSV